MNKCFSLFCILIVAIALCSCNLPSKTNNTQGKTDITDTYIEAGQELQTDMLTMSVYDTLITSMADNNDLGISCNLSEVSGNVYFIAFGSVTNVSATAFSFPNLIDVKLLFDGKYEYSVTMAPNNISNIVPLKTENFIWYASVPLEVFNSTQKYDFVWNWNEQSDSEAQESFHFEGNNNQYLSAENIKNFHTFTETIEYVLASYALANNNANIVYSVDEKLQRIIVTWNHRFEMDLPDVPDTDFYNPRYIAIAPQLILSYTSFQRRQQGSSEDGYGELTLDLEDAEHTYVVCKRPFTLSSSAGSADFGKYFSTDAENDSNLQKLWTVVNGENLKFTVKYDDITLEKDGVRKTYECADSWKQAIFTLLQIYAECPLSTLNIN